MTTSAFVTLPGVLRKLHEGPLGGYMDLYAADLLRKGYRREAGRRCIKVVSGLSLWLKRKRLTVGALDERILHRYFRYRKRHLQYCDCHDRAALAQFLVLLREHEVCAPRPPVILDSCTQVMQDFGRHLSGRVGLAPASIIRRLPTVRRFWLEQVGDDVARCSKLAAADIIGFVERHAHDFGPWAAHSMCLALRSFLRYLRYRGDIKTDLAGAVPSVRQWKLSQLPRFLSAQQVQRIVDHCDRSSARGKRDYAVLLLLARLGLRSNEVVTLTLDDIDWHSGQFTLRNTKTERAVHMPLPTEVGAALVDYLKAGRPSSVSRRVFLREPAPCTGFLSTGAVYNIVRNALGRAGVNAPYKGPHLFRHSLATQMLGKGAPLSEIGQLLRHRDPDTTRIYAKVGIPTLRTLALPWPGGMR